MKTILKFKGLKGTVEFSVEDNVYFGKLKGIRDVITFEGSTMNELTKAFHNAVDDYLETRKRMNKPRNL